MFEDLQAGYLVSFSPISVFSFFVFIFFPFIIHFCFYFFSFSSVLFTFLKSSFSFTFFKFKTRIVELTSSHTEINCVVFFFFVKETILLINEKGEKLIV